MATIAHKVVFWLVLLTSGCAVLRIPDAELNSAHRDPSIVAPPLRLAWTYNAGAGFGEEAPIVLGDHVLVATRNGDLHAISVTSGKRLGIKSFGESLEGAPITSGRMLYVPVDMGRRSLVAFDLERSTIAWRRSGDAVSVGLLALESGFVSVDQVPVVRRHDGSSVVWERLLDEQHQIHARPLLASGHIIIADEAGLIQALDPGDGAVVWQQPLRFPVFTGMASAAGRIFVSTTRGTLFALSAANGTMLWTYTHQDKSARLATAATDASTVVFGATDGTVTALEADSGRALWQWQGDGAIAGAPYLNEHAVYVGSMGSMVSALDRHTGTLSWETKLRGRIKSAVAGYDDFLVVLSEPRYVYLLKSEAE